MERELVTLGSGLEQLRKHMNLPKDCATISDTESRSPEPIPWRRWLECEGVPTYYAERAQKALGGPDYSRIIELRDIEQRPPFVILWSENRGNGKTHMATWLFSQWLALDWTAFHDRVEASRRGGPRPGWQPSALWASEYDFTLAMKNYDRRNFSAQEVMGHYARPGLLLIDDFLTEQTSDNDLSNIVELFEKRKNAGRYTIATTNVSPKEIAEEFSLRLADRLLEGVIVHVKAESHRKEIYRQRREA